MRPFASPLLPQNQLVLEEAGPWIFSLGPRMRTPWGRVKTVCTSSKPFLLEASTILGVVCYHNIPVAKADGYSPSDDAARLSRGGIFCHLQEMSTLSGSLETALGPHKEGTLGPNTHLHRRHQQGRREEAPPSSGLWAADGTGRPGCGGHRTVPPSGKPSHSPGLCMAWASCVGRWAP